MYFSMENVHMYPIARCCTQTIQHLQATDVKFLAKTKKEKPYLQTSCTYMPRKSGTHITSKQIYVHGHDLMSWYAYMQQQTEIGILVIPWEIHPVSYTYKRSDLYACVIG